MRYRPRPLIVVRASEGVDVAATVRLVAAGIRSNTKVRISSAARIEIPGVEGVTESDNAFLASLPALSGVRIRFIGPAPSELHAAAWRAGADLIDGDVLRNGRLELLPFLREQAVSRTRHRFGNVLA